MSEKRNSLNQKLKHRLTPLNSPLLREPDRRSHRNGRECSQKKAKKGKNRKMLGFVPVFTGAYLVIPSNKLEWHAHTGAPEVTCCPLFL